MRIIKIFFVFLSLLVMPVSTSEDSIIVSTGSTGKESVVYGKEKSNEKVTNEAILDAILTFRADISTEIHKLEKTTKDLTERFDALNKTTNERFDALNKTMNALNKTTNERFDALNKTTNERFDALNKTTNRRFDELVGMVYSTKKSQELASLCAVAITVGPKSDLGNDKACGSLVNIDNKKYVLTNRHVIVGQKQKQDCARNIPSITTAFGNQPVPIIRENALYAQERDIDLAIIPVDENSLAESTFQWTFCNVTNKTSLPALQDELFGIAPIKPKQVRAVYGRVLASSLNGPLIYGDFEGTHGFSGTGYYLNSELVAVHRGLKAQDKAFFQHDLPLIEKDFAQNFTNVIKKGDQASDDDILDVADTILDLIEVHGQTPESEAVRAFHVYTGDVELSLSDLESCDEHREGTMALF